MNLLFRVWVQHQPLPARSVPRTRSFRHHLSGPSDIHLPTTFAHIFAPSSVYIEASKQADSMPPASAARKKARHARSCVGSGDRHRHGAALAAEPADGVLLPASDHASSDEETVESERHYSAYEVARQIQSDKNLDLLYQHGLAGLPLDEATSQSRRDDLTPW